MTLTEMFYVVKLDTNKTDGSFRVSLRPGGKNSAAGQLKALGSIFKRYRYSYAAVEYTGCVGSTEGGSIAFGYMYDTDEVPDKGWSWSQITANAPNKQCAIYKSCRMVVPIAKMMPQRWLETDSTTEAAPGQVVIRVQASKAGQEVGYMRIAYTIHFAGPHL